MPQKCRNVCFTLNNPTLDEISDMIAGNRYKYLIFGFETGEEGTDHLQGYAEFAESQRMGELKLFLKRAHFEKRLGTVKQAVTYCKKEGHWWEFGICSEQGANPDFQDIMRMIERGCSSLEIRNEYPALYTRYSRGIEEAIELSRTYNYQECEICLCRDKSINIYDIPGFLLEGFHDMSTWEGQETIVVDRNFPRSYIERWARNIPVTIKNGYKNRIVLPKTVIWVNPWYNEQEDTLNELLNIYAPEESRVILDLDLKESLKWAEFESSDYD